MAGAMARRTKQGLRKEALFLVKRSRSRLIGGLAAHDEVILVVGVLIQRADRLVVVLFEQDGSTKAPRAGTAGLALCEHALQLGLLLEEKRLWQVELRDVLAARNLDLAPRRDELADDYVLL